MKVPYFLAIATILLCTVLTSCNRASVNTTSPETALIAEPLNSTNDAVNDPLEKIWWNGGEFEYLDYSFENKCQELPENTQDCYVTIRRNGKKVFDEYFGHTREEWQRIGFLKVLNTKNDQAIIQLYSGGAHCCLDYVIYDLEPEFRPIYDSRGPDRISIVDELRPVDLNGDGIMEFLRLVGSFDYLSPYGHAGASFPPAIFEYDNTSGKFELANKKYPDVVLKSLRSQIDAYPDWITDNAKYGTVITPEDVREDLVRSTFVYWVYAGKKDEAWKYFDENYTFPNREKYRKDFLRLFQEDPTYRSIYGTK